MLTLATLDGLDRASVAEILGLPLGTVDSRLHAGRRALREQLARGS